MGADLDSAADLLRRAEAAEARSIARTLLTAAAFGAAAVDKLIRVGGAAVNLHTGSYQPTDLDVVGWWLEDHELNLADLEFEKQGRYWLYTFNDGETLAIEVPDTQLFELAEHQPDEYDLDPGQVAVISLDDLVMDRLLQATGGEPVTFDEAVRLAIAAYGSIDWDSLTKRADAASKTKTLAGADLPDVLRRVRSEARRAIRS